MRRYNKNLISAASVAALIAALSLSGCGSAESIAPKSTKASTESAQTVAPALSTLLPIESAPETVTEIPEIVDPELSGDVTESGKKKSKKKTTTKAAATTVATTTTTTASTTTTTTKAVIPQTYATVVVQGDKYAGSYVEKFVGTGTMDVSNIGNNKYSIHITWAVDSSEYNTWDIVGTFDANGVMNYTGCVKNNTVVRSDGSKVITTIYTNGNGAITIDANGVDWDDNMGDILPDTLFNRKTAQPGTTTTTTTASAATTTTTVITAVPELVDTDFATGNFYEANGYRINLSISKNNNNTYDCVIVASESAYANNEYHFTARMDGDTLVYDGGYLSRVEYGDNGVVVSNSVTSQNHYGSIISSDTGLVWYDSDGSNNVFVH